MSEKSQPTTDPQALTHAGEIIERFGGIRPMASKMAVPVTTVQGWKKRDVIPGNRREDVVRAAQVNDIDISDLLGQGPANENAAEKPFLLRVEEAIVPPPPATKPEDQEGLFRVVNAAQRKAVQQSAAFSALLVAAALALGFVLLMPGHRQIKDHGQRLSVLEQDVGAVKKEKMSLKNLIPGDIEGKFSSLQQQAQALQGQIGSLVQQTQSVAAGITGGAPLAERLTQLEQQVGSLTGPAGLAALMDKIKAFQSTPEGQQNLMTALGDLGSLVQGVTAPDQLEGALAQAQQEDDALGQTLQGVQPTDLKAAALLLALTQFRSSLNRDNTPFESDLALVRNLVGQDNPEMTAALDRLAPQAAKGVLTPSGLNDQFRGLAGEIVVASLSGEDVTVRERAMARLSEVLQVSKDGQPVTGTDTQATVARAQALLDKGDVAAATEELKSLEGPAAEKAQPWIAQAEMTLMAQKAKAMLTNSVAGQLGGLGSVLNMGGTPYTTGGPLQGFINKVESISNGPIILPTTETPPAAP